MKRRHLYEKQADALSERWGYELLPIMAEDVRARLAAQRRKDGI